MSFQSKPLPNPPAASIWARKLDLLYLTFFLIHIPVMLFVDLNPLWPSAVKPGFMTTVRAYYIGRYRDRFFVQPPAWFNLFMWLELGYHLPTSLWAVGGLLRGDPMVPAYLLIFAVETVVTTATCIADFSAWTDFPTADKLQLAYLYGPYLVFGVIMGLDMFMRLRKVLTGDGPKLRKD